LSCGGRCCNPVVSHRGNLGLNDEVTGLFFYQGMIDIKGQTAFVYECSNFNKESKLCNDYENRPQICRDFGVKECWQEGCKND